MQLLEFSMLTFKQRDQNLSQLSNMYTYLTAGFSFDIWVMLKVDWGWRSGVHILLLTVFPPKITLQREDKNLMSLPCFFSC